MQKPTRFAEHRWVGDKRTQVVYDLESDDTPEEAIQELLEAETYLVFAPDTLPEARNRGYKPHR
jgi:hypothetical protein